MVFSMITGLLTDNITLLKSEVSKSAYQGVAIAIAAILIATMMVCYFANGTLSIDGMWAAQKHNPALWVLNLIPFVFGFWGQYSGTLISYKAGAMVIDQTHELRTQTDTIVKQTAYVTTHDQLTDLPNRLSFYEQVGKVIVSGLASDTQAPRLSILLVEIENVKEIYDSLGMNSGNLVLKQIANRLKDICLTKDVVAKIDSNLFAVMLPEGQSQGRGVDFAQDIQKAMETPILIDRLYIDIQTNVGIVRFPEQGKDVEELVQKAGVALHLAHQTYNGYAEYEPSIDLQNPLRFSLMSDLRHAIVYGELELFYQPQIAVKTGEVCGVEALLRWNHPKHGYVPPDEIIPMSERNRGVQLTQWVLRRAFQDCVNWHEQGLKLKISINLSPKDLHNPELPDFISTIATSTGISPEWILLEITEGSLITKPEGAYDVIQRLHQMGYKFTIDNYGVGHSSLAYLKKLPLSELKIDKSFIMDILTNDDDATIVKATINLAHNLGFTVKAAGVESKEIMDKLGEYGCDIAQGFYLSKPMSVESFNNWLGDSKRKIG